MDIVSLHKIDDIKNNRNIIYAALAVALCFLMIVIIQRNKIAKVRKQNEIEKERTRISRDLHDDLGSGLVSILMMSEQIQKNENKDLFKTNIEKIMQSSKLMMDQTRIIIWALNSVNDTLENLLLYIEIYFKDFFIGTPVKFNILLPENIQIGRASCRERV